MRRLLSALALLPLTGAIAAGGVSIWLRADLVVLMARVR